MFSRLVLQSSRFNVQSFRAWSLGSRIKGIGFQGSEFRVFDFEIIVQGL